MKNKINQLILFCTLLISLAFNTFAQKKDYPIKPVAFTKVHVEDNFWQPKMEINAKVTIPYVIAQCKANGRMDNFLRAGKK
ncbi:hypothetical protein [Pedobacter sp. P26]